MSQLKGILAINVDYIRTRQNNRQCSSVLAGRGKTHGFCLKRGDIMDRTALYFRRNVQVEPLSDSWYASPHLIPLATNASNIVEIGEENITGGNQTVIPIANKDTTRKI
jgi:hypothetical protein